MSSINTHYQAQVADLLNQIRAHQGEASNRAELINSDTADVGPTTRAEAPSKGNFATYMSDAFHDVNDAQQASADLKNAYERGEDIPLTDVVLSCRKHRSASRQHCRYVTNC